MAIHLNAAILNDEFISLRYDKNGKVDPKYYPFDKELQNGDEIMISCDPNILTPKPKRKQKIKNKEKTKKIELKKEK